MPCMGSGPSRMHSSSDSQSLRVTPAMEAGISDHIWTIEELILLLESKEITKALFRVDFENRPLPQYNHSC